MTKIFLDTNVWLRYFLKDNKQFEPVNKLINLVEEGNFLPYISSIVILEIAFVLGRTYKMARREVLKYLRAVLETRNLTVLENTDSKVAIDYFSKLNVKFSDCLLASQITKDIIFVSFDQDFLKFKGLITKTPADVLPS